MWIKDYRLLISLNIINKDSDDIFKHGKTSWNEVCTSVSLQPYGKTTLLVVSKKWSYIVSKVSLEQFIFWHFFMHYWTAQSQSKKIGMLSKTWQTKLQPWCSLSAHPTILNQEAFEGWAAWGCRVSGSENVLRQDSSGTASHNMRRTKAWSRSTNSAFRPVVFSPSFFNSSLSSATCHADKRTKWPEKWIGRKESDEL